MMCLIYLGILKKSPERARECFYYLSLGYYRLENYEEAKKYAEDLLKIEPENLQAQSLLEKINEKVTRRTYSQYRFKVI